MLTFINPAIVLSMFMLTFMFVILCGLFEWKQICAGSFIISLYLNCCFRSNYQEDKQGRIQDFKLGWGGHLKKLRRAEMFGVFRVKNHDFTPKNHIFSNFRGGGGAGCTPHGSAPDKVGILLTTPHVCDYDKRGPAFLMPWSFLMV